MSIKGTICFLLAVLVGNGLALPLDLPQKGDANEASPSPRDVDMFREALFAAGYEGPLENKTSMELTNKMAEYFGKLEMCRNKIAEHLKNDLPTEPESSAHASVDPTEIDNCTVVGESGPGDGSKDSNGEAVFNPERNAGNVAARSVVFDAAHGSPDIKDQLKKSMKSANLFDLRSLYAAIINDQINRLEGAIDIYLQKLQGGDENNGSKDLEDKIEQLTNRIEELTNKLQECLNEKELIAAILKNELGPEDTGNFTMKDRSGESPEIDNTEIGGGPIHSDGSDEADFNPRLAIRTNDHVVAGFTSLLGDCRGNYMGGYSLPASSKSTLGVDDLGVDDLRNECARACREIDQCKGFSFVPATYYPNGAPYCRLKRDACVNGLVSDDNDPPEFYRKNLINESESYSNLV